MRRFAAVATMLLTIPVFALAQIRSAPLSHHTGADAARVAGPIFAPNFNQRFNGRGFNQFGNRRFDGRRSDGGHFGRSRNNVIFVPSYGYPYIGDSLLDGDGYESNQSQSPAPGPSVVVVPQSASPDVTELRREIDRLSRQLDSMHAQASSPMTEASVPDQPPTLLVFRDQHVEQIHNYAIVGENLWALDSGTGVMGRKIPLAQLDLPETAHANAEHGIHFSTPAGSVR